MLGHELSEVKRCIRKVDERFAQMGDAETGEALRDVWEEFLHEFGRAVGKLIHLSKSCEKTKAFGHKLHQASQKDDEGLVFLREARNVVEHGLVAFARFNDAYVEIPGVGKFNGSGRISFQGGFLNGRPMGNFAMNMAGGRIENLDGRPLVKIVESSSEVVLGPVTNPEKHKTIGIPASVFGKPIDPSKPDSLAREATTGLHRCFQDLTEILNN